MFGGLELKRQRASLRSWEGNRWESVEYVACKDPGVEEYSNRIKGVGGGMYVEYEDKRTRVKVPGTSSLRAIDSSEDARIKSGGYLVIISRLWVRLPLHAPLFNKGEMR